MMEKRKAMMTLLSSRAFSTNGPMMNAVPNEKSMAVMSGSICRSMPSAAPANAACDMQ